MGTSCRGANLTSAPFIIDVTQQHGDHEDPDDDGAHGVHGIVSVHCREEGCIGKYTPRGLRDFQWNFHYGAREELF